MNNNLQNKLIGKWMIDPTDVKAKHEYGDVTMEFKEDRSLIYVIHEKDKDQVMKLTFRVENAQLITNQLSSSREERTPFVLTADDKLIMGTKESRSTYVRVSESTPMYRAPKWSN